MTTLSRTRLPVADTTVSSPPASGGAVLSVGIVDMHCAACAVFIEEQLGRQRGVARAYVHYATQRARINFDPSITSRDALLGAIQAMGYQSGVESAAEQLDLSRRTRRRHLWLFGLATLCAMQLMMLTVPRFLAGQDLEPELAALLDWGSLLLVLPVLLVSVRPFYAGTLREVATRRIGMDSAVVLGIVTAFLGSCWHLFQQSGQLYFDSISMFVALLLGVRWFEWEQSERNREIISRSLADARQRKARRVRKPGSAGDVTASDEVAAADVGVGDWIVVLTGEALPLDGRLQSSSARIDESMLTGESALVTRGRGDLLFAGAINCGSAVAIEVTAKLADSAEQQLLSLADASCKPAALRISERVARWFMPALMIAAAATFVVVLPQGVELALERAIAVIIVSCPCALALAAPAAYARAFALLAGRHAIVRRDGALERLAASNHFILDKTGTLTEPAIDAVEVFRVGMTERACIEIIAALEQAASHPLARAILATRDPDTQLPEVSGGQWIAGEGVTGCIGGVAYSFGRATFAKPSTAMLALSDQRGDSLWLCDEQGAVCQIVIGETLQDGARSLVDLLKARGQVEICSGDAGWRVARIAKELGIQHWGAGMTPQQKAQRVQSAQAQGHVVAMIGDGINDSLGFAGADIAIATGDASDIARASADFVCTERHLRTVEACVRLAATTHGVIKSNFAWAIGYNLVAVPCAILGWVNPVVAGVGMAASSAIVMLNVLRIRMRGEKV